MEKRVVATLERFVLLSQRDGARDVPVINLTQEQLARLCYRSRQTVTGVLARLADQGLVVVRSRSVELVDLTGLRHIIDLAE